MTFGSFDSARRCDADQRHGRQRTTMEAVEDEDEAAGRTRKG